MDPQSWTDNKNVRAALIIILSLGAIFLLVKSLKEIRNFNDESNNLNPHLISVTGKGEITTVADIASFSFSATESGKTVKEAQDKATAKSNAALKFLKDNGIEERDIKTTDYNIYPKYSYSQMPCREGSCPPSTSTITGYDVSQNIQVKVRDTSKAGDMLSGIGNIGVSNVSGLQFTVDDQDVLMDQAREKAIADARSEAKKLAEELGVRLGKVVSFNENNGGYPMPYYAKDSMMGMGGVAEAPQAAPQIPSGENKITSYVTVTYEIH